jgi:hypothetical protein
VTIVSNRGHWVWVTRPDFYAEADGSDRLELEPSEDYEPGGWWTCHESTKRGDLVLLYRTAPRSDVRYLIQAESDAYSLADDEFARQQGWAYGCDYRVLHKIDPPISLAELRGDEITSNWQADRVSFNGRSFFVPPECLGSPDHHGVRGRCPWASRTAGGGT